MAMNATTTPKMGDSSAPIDGILNIQTLPYSGMSRFNQFQAFLPISREKFRQWSLPKKHPSPYG